MTGCLKRFARKAQVAPAPCAMAVLLALSACNATAQDPVRSVNPLIGSGGCGRAFPGATLPFGMAQLGPDTRGGGNAWSGYRWEDDEILGFSHMHRMETSEPDYGDMLFMPFMDDGSAARGQYSAPRRYERVARFSHDDERVSPGYYRVLLKDDGIIAELTATLRSGMHRYTFLREGGPALLLDAGHGLGGNRAKDAEIRVAGPAEIEGFRRSSVAKKDRMVYFVARFSRPIITASAPAGAGGIRKIRIASGPDACARLRFDVPAGFSLLVKVGLSMVDIEGARRNLEEENPGWDFDAVRDAAEARWRRELSSALVTGGRAENQTIFYTMLYFSMLAPNLSSDADGRYRSEDGRVRRSTDGAVYSCFPAKGRLMQSIGIMTLLHRERVRDFARSAAVQGIGYPLGKKGMNESDNASAAVSAPLALDAWMKGVREFDIGAVFKSLTSGAALPGRTLDTYEKYGFYPAEESDRPLSATLERAYTDWCAARIAGILGKEKARRDFDIRAQYWRNVFDPSTKSMRARSNGGWLETARTGVYDAARSVEDESQALFYAPHDAKGLMDAHGGVAGFVSRLDAFFGIQDDDSLQVGEKFGSAARGRYLHGSALSANYPYLYHYAGFPWRAQAVLRYITDSMYSAVPGAPCCGLECGAHPAWYVAAAIGLCQVCPGIPQYCIGTPLFPRTLLRTGGGHSFEIAVEYGGLSGPYIRAAALNGAPFTRSYLRYDEIAAGGAITCAMDAQPNAGWGAAPNARPTADADNDFVPAPAIVIKKSVSADSAIVEITSLKPGAVISCIIEENGRRISRKLYDRPFVVSCGCEVMAEARFGDSASPQVRAAVQCDKPRN